MTDLANAYERRATLFIICGLPGSGKSTHARKLAASVLAIDLSADEWMDALAINLYDERARERVERLQWTIAQELLKLGVSVIIEWGTWGRSERDELRVGAQRLGAAVELHYLTAPLDVLFERVQRRGMEDPPLTRDDLARYATAIQVPNDDELALYDRAVVIGT
jgi:predicted kinase